MKALVTGGSGFIGSTLVKALSKNGYELILLSRQKNINYDTITCNLGTDKIPESAFEDVDIVFHLAGYTHDLVNSPNKDKFYYDVNVKATIELIKLAINKGAKKFIYLSSVKAGGVVDQNRCISEKDQGVPSDIYGITKRDAELKLLDIGSKLDMQVSIIRPSLLYGPNMKGNLNSMMSAIKSGWFPPLPRINNKRSLVHVDDLVRAIIFIATNEQAKSEIYILTDGKPHSSREIYEVMCNILGKSIPYWSMPIICFRLISFINHKYARRVDKLLSNEHYSSKKIQSLGFKPKFSLKDMNETSF